MKTLKNWKAWTSKDGSKKRIYVNEVAYLEEGYTGLCNGVNLLESEISFLNETIGKTPFETIFAQVKRNKSEKKSTEKAKKENRKMKLAEIKNLPYEQRMQAMKENGYI